jgi:hypothetical protein
MVAAAKTSFARRPVDKFAPAAAGIRDVKHLSVYHERREGKFFLRTDK